MSQLDGAASLSRWPRVALPLAVALVTVLILYLGAAIQAEQTPTTAATPTANLSVSTTGDTGSAPANLAPNPSFEHPDPTDGSSPAEWSNETRNGPKATFHWFYGIASEGERSVCIISTKSSTKSCWLTEDYIPVTPTTRYYFSGWVRTQDISGRACLGLSFWNETLKQNLGDYESTAVISGTDWVEVRGSAVAPAEAKWMRLETRLHGAGIVWFDDVSLSDVEPQPIFQVSLHDNPDPVDAGTQLAYTLVITNIGNLTEEALTITLSLDDYLTVHSTEPPTTSTETNTLVWTNLPPLWPGESERITVTTTVDSPLPNGLLLESEAEVNGQATAAVEVTEFTQVRSAPLLRLAKLAPEVITAGQHLTYTIVFTNVGNDIASFAVIVDDYPSNPNCFDSSSLPTSWPVTDVQPAETGTIVTSGPVSSQCVTATVLHNQVVAYLPEQPPTNAAAQTRVIGIDTDCWHLELCPPSSACYIWPHEDRTYNFEIENTGNQPVTNTHLAISNTLGWSSDHFVVSPTVIGWMEPGEKRQVAISMTSPACVVSDTVNTLTLTATGEPGVTDATTTTAIVGRYINIEVEPRVSTHIIQPADTLTFSHRVTNTGNFTTTFLLVNEDVPTGWTVTWTPNPTLTIGPCKVDIRTATIDHPHEGETTILTKIAPAENPEQVLDVIINDVVIKIPETHLPLTLRCWPGPVAGPLESGRTWTYDGRDWYYVDMPGAGTLEVTVSGLNVDGNLLLYSDINVDCSVWWSNDDLLANYGGNDGGTLDPMVLTYNAPQAMRIYILVYVPTPSVPTYTIRAEY